MYVHAPMYAGGVWPTTLPYTPPPRTIPWKPSWATLECVFTAQWLLTGVSRRAAVLSAPVGTPRGAILREVGSL